MSTRIATHLRSGAACTLGVLVGLALATARAQTPLVDVEVSPDITVDLSGTIVDDDQTVVDPPSVAMTLGLPSNVDLTAFHDLGGGVTLFAIDVTAALGAITASPNDVVQYDGASYSVVLDGSLAGVPTGARIDAIGELGGDLLLSFDITVDLGGLTVDDEDVVLWNGAFNPFLDGSAAGIDPALDVDGVHHIPLQDVLLVSFDTSGSVGGVPFDDEDVLEWDLVAAAWAPGKSYDGSLAHPGWTAADLDAVHAVTDFDLDGIPDAGDSCPTTPDVPVGGDVDGDGVNDACDTCIGLFNPAVANPSDPVTGDPAFPNGWMTLVSGQRDDDGDGAGNRCDADFDQAGAVVGGTDLSDQREAFNQNRAAVIPACGPGPTAAALPAPCDVYDMDEAGALIGGGDLTQGRLRFNTSPGPACGGPDGDGDGIADVCDPNPAGPSGPGIPGYFSALGSPQLGRALCEGTACP